MVNYYKLYSVYIYLYNVIHLRFGKSTRCKSTLLSTRLQTRVAKDLSLHIYQVLFTLKDFKMLLSLKELRCKLRGDHRLPLRPATTAGTGCCHHGKDQVLRFVREAGGRGGGGGAADAATQAGGRTSPALHGQGEQLAASNLQSGLSMNPSPELTYQKQQSRKFYQGRMHKPLGPRPL